MELTTLPVAVTKASLESYVRLMLTIVLTLTVLEMVGVWMALTVSAVTVVQATQEHCVKLIQMIVLELPVMGMENAWME